jgi:hypothetical protein
MLRQMKRSTRFGNHVAEVQLIGATQWLRPLRLKGIDPERTYAPNEIKALAESTDADAEGDSEAIAGDSEDEAA